MHPLESFLPRQWTSFRLFQRAFIHQEFEIEENVILPGDKEDADN